MKLSVVTPAFNEAANLPTMHDRLGAALGELGFDWEWIIVDDHSRDTTFAVVREMASRDARVRGVRLARNSGSHTAITCGLHLAGGDAAVILAADLQDPPEILPALVDRWRAGAQIVCAARRTRPGDRSHAGFATLYYWLMRKVVGLREMPERGADFVLVDRVVIDAVRQYHERHVSIFALIVSLGFRQEVVEYDKQPRLAGRSGWTMARKVGLVVDSVTSFSNFPIRLCTLIGAVLLALGIVTVAVSLLLLPSLGAGILFVLGTVTAFAGLQLLALGIVGEYVWRALDEARGRPLYIIEAATAPHGSPTQADVALAGSSRR